MELTKYLNRFNM